MPHVGNAVFARTASVVEPGDADRIARFKITYSGAGHDDSSRRLVSRYEGRSGFDGPVAASRVKIGVTDAACNDLHE
jgi:hypothetical protein